MDKKISKELGLPRVFKGKVSGGTTIKAFSIIIINLPFF
jgi:hypothetical protein